MAIIRGNEQNNFLSRSNDKPRSDDSLIGVGGDDIILLGLGSDSGFGGAGDDRIVILTATETGVPLGSRHLADGGGGIDSLKLGWAQFAGATIRLVAGEGRLADGTVYRSIERFDFTGSPGNRAEHVTGGRYADVISTGGGRDHLDGGAGNDVLYGGDGADTITGGRGFDRMIGDRIGPGEIERGADVFLFDTPIDRTERGTDGRLQSRDRDAILDFDPAADVIALSHDVFARLDPGALERSAFVANPVGQATKAAHRIVYNTADGTLAYDRDGRGSAEAVIFAELRIADDGDRHPALTAADILVL
jgi:Ca2+-binding RTX toxin-like protein